MAKTFVTGGLAVLALSVTAGATAFAATDGSTTPAERPKADRSPPERPCPRYLPQAATLKEGTPLFHRLGDEPPGVMIAAVDRREGNCRRPLILQSLVPLPADAAGTLTAL